MLKFLEPIDVECIVIGAGIAGCWSALKLSQRGIKTALIYYEDKDRGGKPGSTHFSAGAINTGALYNKDYENWLNIVGERQVAKSIGRAIQEQLEDELIELQKYASLRKINIGYELKSCSAKELLNRLLKQFTELGGQIIHNGWVVKINASDSACHGIQYQKNGKIGVIHSGAILMAAGGYASLLKGSMKTSSFGSLHGRFLQAGGELCNTEFIFSHGFGSPDTGDIIPTEELPGVEIVDSNNNHVLWLEEELFNRNGTYNHLQAFMLWHKDQNAQYFVDFTFRDVNRLISEELKKGNGVNTNERADIKNKLYTTLSKNSCPDNSKELKLIIERLIDRKIDYDFSLFRKVKSLMPSIDRAKKQRIMNIPYFSLGGVNHDQFKTNLHNVFVNGEMMHDFGANRVGGVPWALYLCAATTIANKIAQLKQDDLLTYNKKQIDKRLSHYDQHYLPVIQEALFQAIKAGYRFAELEKQLKILGEIRLQLEAQGKELDDIVSYLLVAESILVSAKQRQESRGSFLTEQFTQTQAAYDYKTTVSFLDKTTSKLDITRH